MKSGSEGSVHGAVRDWVGRRTFWARSWAALGVACVSWGCSGGDGRVAVYPVNGRVSVAGEVPEGALVVLYPARKLGEEELRPSGRVAKDGSFRLTTYEADDGAPTGEYTATVQWNKLVKKGRDYAAGPNVVPKTYANPETSAWKIKVAEAPNELPPLRITR